MGGAKVAISESNAGAHLSPGLLRGTSDDAVDCSGHIIEGSVARDVGGHEIIGAGVGKPLGGAAEELAEHCEENGGTHHQLRQLRQGGHDGRLAREHDVVRVSKKGLRRKGGGE